MKPLWIYRLGAETGICKGWQRKKDRYVVIQIYIHITDPNKGRFLCPIDSLNIRI
jgi:hypothetical protein